MKKQSLYSTSGENTNCYSQLRDILLSFIHVAIENTHAVCSSNSVLRQNTFICTCVAQDSYSNVACGI